MNADTSTQRIYLDHAAATPVWPAVREVSNEVLQLVGNPMSHHASGRRTWHKLKAATQSLAQLLGINQSELVVTSGATESNTFAIAGALSNPAARGRLLLSALEHPSVVRAAEQYAPAGVEIVRVPVQKNGTVSPETLEQLLTPDTLLVSVSAASHELGVIQPIRRIAQRIRRYNTSHNARILFHTDASQLAAWEKVAPHGLGVDLLTISGAKVGSGTGTGLLYMKTGTNLQPLLPGGGQQLGRRGGTEDLRAITALAVGLRETWRCLPKHSPRIRLLRDDLVNQLHAVFPDIEYNQHPEGLPNIVSLTLTGIDESAAVYALDAAGIEVSTGAACSGAKENLSSLIAIGRSKKEARATLRLTLGWETTAKQVKEAVRRIGPVLTTARTRNLRTKTLKSTGEALAQAYSSRYTESTKETRV